MEISRIPLKDITQFSKRDRAYIEEIAALRPFYKYSVDIASFETVIADKKGDQTDRPLLVQALTAQYSSLTKSELVQKNVDLLLDEKTFTIVTAHQPSLFTGPLYYIYKILSTIRLSEVLKETYPSYNFVPVFVSGAEDHDFEEVNHAKVFSKTISWENDESGAVGHMSTKKLAEPLAELKEMLGNNENALSIFQKIEHAYTANSSYGKATIELIHDLFKSFGLVVLDMSVAALKRVAIPIFKKELLQQASAPLVEASISKLNEIGFNAQASPREINLFYLHDQIRSRIVFEDKHYKVLDSSFTFSENELLSELENHPERFSPNVVMRPLYQELILPNLAYIGGGGEIAYWLERKTQFEHFGINFPMLIRRSSGLIIGKGHSKKMAKLNLSLGELLKEEEDLIKHFINQNASTELSLAKQKGQLKTIFNEISDLAKAIDPTLSGSVKAEQVKQLKSLEAIEARFVKAEKKKSEVSVNQIRALKASLFPSRSLQERKVNFLSFYINHGDAFFETLKMQLNPLDKDFVVFVE